MLTHLHIENFTLVDHLDVEFNGGLTSVTGETGAGKSITLDALALAVGDRADGDKVRAGKDKSDIQANFDITDIKRAQSLLNELEIEHDNECILRRVITSQGRSRAFINGQSVTLAQLKKLGAMLLDIHSQHEHQSLLNPITQRHLLDAFADVENLTIKLKQAFSRWQSLQKKIETAKNSSAEMNAQHQLLSYQVDELNQLDLQEKEVESLEQEQKELDSIATVLQTCEQLQFLCNDEESGLSHTLNKALHLIRDLPVKSNSMQEAENLMESASIHVEEAQSEIDSQMNQQADDEGRLTTVESRLTAIYEVARKHRIQPNQLFDHHQALQEELSQLVSGDDQLDQLQEQAETELASYTAHAHTLSKKRKAAAKKLSLQVNKKLELLSMSHANFVIDLEPIEAPARHGAEIIQFLISTQPGHPPKPLNKIASGGELSRISLAIQVVTAQTSAIPTMIFDEVDVGIGGPTGDIVGTLLRELGNQGQVICVTHLAQVASKAHHHLLVNKTIDKKSVTSSVIYIKEEQTVEELARMMGGNTQSEQSLAHARQMLDWKNAPDLIH